MKIEELAEKILAEFNSAENKTPNLLAHSEQCIRAGLKVALKIIDECQDNNSIYPACRLGILQVLEGRAELPEVEG